MSNLPAFTPARVFEPFIICTLPLLIGILFGSTAAAIDNNEIFVEVTRTESPPSITFTWDTQADGVSVEISRRELGQVGPDTWNLLTTVDHPTQTWTDDTLSTGIAYEYKVYRPWTDVANHAGTYVAAGFEAPLTEDRGIMLVLCEEDLAAALPDELRMLEMDLVADGWEVIRRSFPRDRDASHRLLRSWIVSQYEAAPDRVKGIYLFGRLPIVYTAPTNPDHHNAVPHATDTYYADIDDEWSDSDPSDNQLDGTYIPGNGLELINGRVDLAGMSAWTKTEEELLRDYLGKAHNFKRGYVPVPRRGTPGGHGNLRGEEQLLYAMFAPEEYYEAEFSGDGLTTDDGDPQPLEFLWVASGGNWRGADYADNEHKAMFCINFASHKQKWSNGNNQMRALLAQPKWGLTCSWGARPYWFFHHTEMGKTAGYSALRTQNNGTQEYYPDGYFSYGGAMWNNLMGDPSLRTHPVIPPTDVQATRSGGNVDITWTASTDTAVQGYHVYRSADRLGQYTRLNGALITGENFTDTTAPASGDLYYQVRTVKLDTVKSGSYFNQSLGEFAWLEDGETTSNQPPVADDTVATTDEGFPVLFDISGSDPEGADVTFFVADPPANGMLRGKPPEDLLYIPDANFHGTEIIKFKTFDGINTSDAATVTITVNPVQPLLEWEFEDIDNNPEKDLPDDQDLNSDYNHPDVNAAELTVGPGVSIMRDGREDDALIMNGANSNELNADDYISWIVEPVAGKAVSLEKLFFSSFDSQSNSYYLRLRVSLDGFTTWRTVPLGRWTDELVGLGRDIHDANHHYADLSAIPELQNAVGPVEFRLYFWKTFETGIGKNGYKREDLVVIGTTSDAPAGGRPLSLVSDSLGPFYVGETVNQQLVATGGTPPYSFSVLSGNLPSELSLDSDGLLTGTLTATDSGTVTIQVTDAVPASDQSEMTIEILDPPSSEEPPEEPVLGLNVSTTALEIDETQTADFTVELGAPPASDVVVEITSSDSAEATVSPSSLTFTPGNWDSKQTVTVTAVNDDIVMDHSAELTVSIDDAQSDDAYDPLPDHSIYLFLVNNDEPGEVKFLDTYIWDDEDSAGTITFEVERLGGGFGPASVDVDVEPEPDVVPGEDFEFTPLTLNWDDGETGVKTFTITINADSTPEWDEYVAVKLKNPVGVELANSTAQLYIGNDDFQPVPAEDFGTNSSYPDFDLENQMLEFIPNGPDDYDLILTPITEFPEPTTNATVVSGDGPGRIAMDEHFEILLPGGFEFPFYGKNYSSLFLNATGQITFEEANTYKYGSLWAMFSKNSGSRAPRVAPFWDQLETDMGGEILYEVIATPGEERVVITFIDIPIQYANHTVSFQAILHKSGKISMAWEEMNFSVSEGEVDYYYFVVGISDGEAVPGYEGADLSASPPPTVLAIGGTLPRGRVGQAYSELLQAIGGSTPYSWQWESGDALPGTLAIVPGTGELAGTPDAAGYYTFMAQVTDDDGDSDSAEYVLPVISPTSDIDNNGLRDDWEILHFGDLGQDPADDPDEDLADNENEQDNSGDPNEADTDGDGIEDGPEITLGRKVDEIDREPLIWEEGFEDRGPGALSAAPGLWSLYDSGTLELVDALGIGPSRALRVTTDTGQAAHIAQHLETGYESVIWTDFHAKLAPYADDAELPATEPDATVAFYLTESGDIATIDSGGRQIHTLGLTVEDTHRYTVKQDFDNQTWSLWVNGSVVAVDLPFLTPRTLARYLRVTQAEGQESVFDDIRIWRSAPPGLTGGGIQYFGDWQGTITWAGKDSSWSADVNFNGLNNLGDYAFHYHPVDEGVPAQTTWTHDAGASEVTITYRRYKNAHDIEFCIVSTTDFLNWTRVSVDPEDVEIREIDTETEEVSVTLSMVDPECYYRVCAIKR